MKNRLLHFFAIVYATIIMALPITSNALEVLGEKPSHIWGNPSLVSNQQAITKMIWVPGIDDGYVPQGVTFADGAVYVSSYQGIEGKPNKNQCRIFKVDAYSGSYVGYFDMPKECHHAGGLAYIGNNVLIVADAHNLFKIDLNKALQDKNTNNALLSVVKLTGAVQGSFIDFDGTSLFVGGYEKDSNQAKAFFLPLSIFDDYKNKSVNEEVALKWLNIPPKAQGAAFDKNHNLWMTFSGSKHGELDFIDKETGNIIARYTTMIGIEDIGFDDTNKAWSVSEAGSLKWANWSETFPIIFQVDISRLK